jgi:hypothetical protein
VLRELEVIGSDIERAVQTAATQLWADLPEGAVEAGSFRRGVLRVVFDDHARMAEAKSFLADEFHRLLNVQLEQDSEQADGAGAQYVTRVVFHVRGVEP